MRFATQVDLWCLTFERQRKQAIDLRIIGGMATIGTKLQWPNSGAMLAIGAAVAVEVVAAVVAVAETAAVAVQVAVTGAETAVTIGSARGGSEVAARASVARPGGESRSHAIILTVLREVDRAARRAVAAMVRGAPHEANGGDADVVR